MHTHVDILAEFSGACQSEDGRRMVGWTDATVETEALACDIAHVGLWRHGWGKGGNAYALR